MSFVRSLFRGTRILARAPGFTAMVVLMLALGIGATTAMFSVIQGVVLRPLPFPEAGRLVRICETGPSVEGFCVASPPNARDWSLAARTLEDLGLAREWPFLLQGEGGSEEIPGALATPAFFRAFRLAPRAGRLLAPADLETGAAPVVVLSHGFWQARFAGDPAAVGRTLTLDGRPYEIIGVLPPARIPELESAQVWLPLQHFGEENRGWRGFQAVARLRAGAVLEEARGELRVLAAVLAKQHPGSNEGWGITAVPLHEWVVGPVRPTLLIFLAAVGLVLLIACANTANLLLARALARSRELAIRAAVGASRGRLLRLLLGEGVLLALGGCALGVLLARWLLDFFLAAAPPGIPRLEEVALDGGVLAFAIALSLLASLLCGLVPALRASAADVGQVLKGEPPEGPGRPAPGLREGLVVAEVALAMVLLVSAGLLTRSFVAASSWQGGADPRRLLAVSVLAPSDPNHRAAAVRETWLRAVREVAALPGVAAAGTASAGPFFGGRESADFADPDRPGSAPRSARCFGVGSGYFRTVGQPVLRGRPFNDRDGAGAPPVAVVNASLARRLWPGGDAVGRSVRDAQGRGRARQVVGVVADAPPVWPQREAEPEIYWPDQQDTRWATFLLVRTEKDAAGLAGLVRQRLRQVDPGLSVARPATAEELLRQALVRPRFNMLLVGSFTAVALLLALGGTYGVLAFATARRTREIGIRLALGARRRQILGRVIGEALRLAACGIGLGLAGAAALTRWLSALLYETRTMDGATFLAAMALLTLVALAAAWVPARRAARIDPQVAIRAE